MITEPLSFYSCCHYAASLAPSVNYACGNARSVP
jgi:hypothetical protein